jgi:hypothetical protein
LVWFSCAAQPDVMPDRARDRAVGKIERRRPINAKPVYLRQFLASESRAPWTLSAVRTSPQDGARFDRGLEEASMLGIIIALMLLAPPAAARDLGQWQNQPPEVRKWFQRLMQPDVPFMSCCGEADAYWADSFEVDEDHYVAIITDERPDGPLGRPHRELGEKIVVPNHKIKWDEGNPTGHGIIFIGIGGQVYCYVPPGGV